MTADTCVPYELPAPPARALRLPRPTAFAATALTLTAFFFAAGAPTPLLVRYQQQWGFAPAMLALAFGAYALGLLAALLVLGSLSDHVGRRPVLVGAVGLELVALLAFLSARDITWVVLARVVQGVATGAATSAFGAAVLELAPERRPRLGPSVNAVAAAGGLGLGALVAGALASATGSASALIWGSLAAVMVAALVAILFVPETATPRRGALASLVPRVAVPVAARPVFRAAAPAMVGAWMTAALFMGLVPTILGDLWGVHSLAADGAAAAIEPLVAAAASLAVAGMIPRHALGLGVRAVVAGAVLVILGVATSTLPLLLLGGAVGGVGFGATFSGTLRSLAPLAGPHERGAMLSAMYVVSYLAFGVPAIVAGRLVGAVGLLPVVVVFGGVILAGAAAALVLQARLTRRSEPLTARAG
ncbi:MAG TPA: MFS transporter [Cellulomonas sp.]